VLAVGVSALEIFVVIPAFGSGQSFHYVAHYANLGAGADEALQTAASQPVRVIASLFDLNRARYVAELVGGAAPLVLLGLRSVRRSAWPLLLGLPQLLIQLLSSAWQKWSVNYPYGMPIVPLIGAAAVLALAFVPTEKWREARRLAVTAWISLTLLHLAGKIPSPVGQGRPIDLGFRGSARAAGLTKAIEALPQDASISAQDDVVPHVAARSEVHRWPDGQETDDYILLDAGGPAFNILNRAALSEAVRQLRADPHFEVVVDQGGVLLAKRVARKDAG
jgi:hypothetical protein